MANKEKKSCNCSCVSGKRCSNRRAAVAEALSAAGKHVSAEETHRLARRLSPGIGIATVYRSLKCLCGCGKAVEIKLGDGAAVYEAAGAGNPLAHAHLVCSACGSVAEAPSPMLVKLCSRLSAGAGFSPSGSLELRGLCYACAQKGKFKR